MLIWVSLAHVLWRSPGPNPKQGPNIIKLDSLLCRKASMKIEIVYIALVVLEKIFKDF
jgi:hypothetical protein